MKEDRDYEHDLAEIRSMMERSSKFLSLSGWAGIMAGIYALAGAYVVYYVFHFHPHEIIPGATHTPAMPKVVLLACMVLVFALGTAILLSARNARQKGEKAWNATSRRLLAHMAIPLATGGILILVLLSKGATGIITPLTLIFYGLALFNAGTFTYTEIKALGLIQVALGLLSTLFIPFALLFWAVGFGALHIVYGIYIHFKYEGRK